MRSRSRRKEGEGGDFFMEGVRKESKAKNQKGLTGNLAVERSFERP